VEDILLAGHSNGYDQDQGSSADDHAQRGQGEANLVAAEGIVGKTENLAKHQLGRTLGRGGEYGHGPLDATRPGGGAQLSATARHLRVLSSGCYDRRLRHQNVGSGLLAAAQFRNASAHPANSGVILKTRQVGCLLLLSVAALLIHGYHPYAEDG